MAHSPMAGNEGEGMTSLRVREVLRGMEVEGAGLRLRRASALAAVADEGGAMPPSVETERSRGYAEGLAQGRAEGARLGHAEGMALAQEEAALQLATAVEQAVAEATTALALARTSLLSVADSLKERTAAVLQIAEDELAALCFDALCRVVGASALQPVTLRRQVSEVLAGAGALHDLVSLRMHPDDVGALQMDGDPALGGISCIADEEVELGGCIAVRRRGSLDLRLETMLSDLKTALIEARAARRAGGAA